VTTADPPNLEGLWVLNGPGTESEIRLTAEGRRDYTLYLQRITFEDGSEFLLQP